MLSGLSRKCGLHLLSPASNPGRSVSMILSCQSSDCIPSNDSKALQSNREREEHIGQSSGSDKRATSSVEEGSSSITATIPTNEGTSRKEASADTGEPHREEENSLLLGHAKNDVSNVNRNPSLSVEEPDHVTVAMEASPLERDGNRNLSSSDDKIFAVNKEPETVTCDMKPSLVATGLVDYSSSSEEEGKLNSDDEDEFDEEPFGLSCLQKESLTMGVFLKDASLAEEDSSASKMVGNDKGLDKKPVGVTCFDKPSTIVPAVTDSSWPEEERSTMKLDSEGPVSLACLDTDLSTVSPILAETTLAEVGTMLNPDSPHKEPVSLGCFQKDLTSTKPVLQDASLAGKELVGVISIVKDFPNITVNKEPAGLVCYGEELSTSSNLEDVTLTGEHGSAVDLDHDGDQLDEELIGLACLKKESSTISAFLHGERSSEESVSAMQLDQDDNELDTKPVSVICDEKPSSTVNEGFSEGEQSSEDDGGKSFVSSDSGNEVDDMEPKRSSVETSTINSSSSLQYGTRTNVPFQTWLQNFKTYCEEQKRVEEKESFQDPPRKRRKKRKKEVLMSVKKDCMSGGNLESRNKCLGVTSGKESYTTARASSSDLNLANATGGHINMVSNVEDETESYSVRNSKTTKKTGCVYVSEKSSTTASSSESHVNLGTTSAVQVISTPGQRERETEPGCARNIEANQLANRSFAKGVGSVYPTEISSLTASSSASALNTENASNEHAPRPTQTECETLCDSVESSETAQFQETTHAYMSEVPSTNAQSSLGNTSGESIIRASHMENEIESDFARNSEDVQFKNTNLFEIFEATDVGDDSSPDCSCARKRPSFLDSSRGGEVRSVKKLKHECKCESNCESKCDERVEKSLSSTRSEWDKSKDLPLMANVDEVLVKHYILDLSVKFSEKIMQGSIVLFLNPRNEEVTKRQFQMTLDITLVNIESVSEVVLPEDFKLTFFGQEENSASTSGVLNGFLGDILGDNSQNPLPLKVLRYSVYGWFVRIWKPDATGKAWPRCIWIKYHTSPEGKSLTWATDQDGK